jgi:hypothetical protein
MATKGSGFAQRWIKQHAQPAEVILAGQSKKLSIARQASAETARRLPSPTSIIWC